MKSSPNLRLFAMAALAKSNPNLLDAKDIKSLAKAVLSQAGGGARKKRRKKRGPNKAKKAAAKSAKKRAAKKASAVAPNE